MKVLQTKADHGLSNRRMTPRVAACAVLAVLAASEEADAQDGRWTSLERDLAAVHRTLLLPGIAAAVVDHGGVVWRGTYGWADVDRRIPVSDSTLFAIASITKTMTSLLVAQELERGRLRLDAPMPARGGRVAWQTGTTIRHVLSHTSEGAIGSEYLYSGSRFSRLGPVLERAAAEPFSELLATRVLRPAEMQHAFPSLAAVPESRRPFVAIPYKLHPNEPRLRATALPDPSVSAASGVVASITDLGHYAAAVLNRRLASQASLDLLFTATHSPVSGALPYGLGWFTQDYLGERVVWHYGQEDAYASLLVLLPDRDLAFVALSNSAAMSDAARLLDGNVARSLVASAFLRRVIPGQRDRLVADSIVARALAAVYVARIDEARELVHSVAASDGGLAADLPLLYLLDRINDRSLDSLTHRVASALLHGHPRHPPVLYFASEFEIQRGRPAEAITIMERIDATANAYDHWSAILCYLQLGEHYAASDSARARVYLQRVLDIGRDFAGAVGRARALLTKRDTVGVDRR